MRLSTIALCSTCLFACSDDAATTPVDAVTDAADDASGCAAPTGPGTSHQGEILSDEVWRASDSPHVVEFEVSIRSATLTIEPCAVVRIRPGYTIEVWGTATAPGHLVAHGEPGREIRFERHDADEPWGSLFAYSTGTIDLEHVIVDGGSAPATATGAIVASGEGGNQGLLRNLRLQHVRVDRSGGFGINLNGRAGITADSLDVTVTRSGQLPPGTSIVSEAPFSIDGAAISTIPPGTYTGNAVDAIVVNNASSLLDPEITIRDRGIPYTIAHRFTMAPPHTADRGPPSVLRIEAGVRMEFLSDNVANIPYVGLGASNGDLPQNIWPVRVIAEGTAAKPIVFTSGSRAPVAGDWGGIEWQGGAADGNVMRHVRIEYAGADSGTQGFGCGPSDNDAAFIITNWRPDDVFLTDSVISDSAAGGIVSGWGTDAGGPDLRANNKFERIANGCNVSRWSNANGSCPSTPPICL